MLLEKEHHQQANKPMREAQLESLLFGMVHLVGMWARLRPSVSVCA